MQYAGLLTPLVRGMFRSCFVNGTRESCDSWELGNKAEERHGMSLSGSIGMAWIVSFRPCTWESFQMAL